DGVRQVHLVAFVSRVENLNDAWRIARRRRPSYLRASERRAQKLRANLMHAPARRARKAAQHRGVVDRGIRGAAKFLRVLLVEHSINRAPQSFLLMLGQNAQMRER